MGQKKPAIQRYFFDTEFNSTIEKFRIDFISIGVVAEDGSEYYGISNEFNVAAANANPWIKEHVMDKLDDPSTWVSVEQIRKNILKLMKPAHVAEFWARNGSYDTVLLCQIFGGMQQFRDALKTKGIDKVSFRDSHELYRRAPNVRFEQEDGRGAHIAINDARYERFAYDLYTKAIEMQDAMPPPHLPHVK